MKSVRSDSVQYKWDGKVDLGVNARLKNAFLDPFLIVLETVADALSLASEFAASMLGLANFKKIKIKHTRMHRTKLLICLTGLLKIFCYYLSEVSKKIQKVSLHPMLHSCDGTNFKVQYEKTFKILANSMQP